MNLLAGFTIQGTFSHEDFRPLKKERNLIFIKYISDAFQTKYDALKAAVETNYTDPEDRDEYAAANIFWVPKTPALKFA